jgi:hypothetical protein
VCDYYLTKITPTSNNLYYLNWIRTIENINSGRMLIASFWLTEADMNRLRLSSKIRIDNGYYYINKIRDYDASKSQLTKVELITIEQSSPLGVNTGNEVKPYDPKDFVDTISRDVITSGRGNTDNIVTKGDSKLRVALSSSIIPENVGNIQVLGNNNFISEGFSGVVIGNNIATQESGVYVDRWKLTSAGLIYTGVRVIDGGLDQVVNLNKTTEPLAIDGGKNLVRNINAMKGPIYIDGGRKI